ncbi:tRNA (uracil-5-)-methyltransferase [Schistosoma bovis]|uniref:tRNA (uracil(54)-C(5))-methyltransferase n=1 Tax=Schistosoma bovis TaxID=6184 RepID=A0A430QNV4_SCHBO|nr:tRNA (uracil-5-)-methyltransferase [Schistosoma bovis]
MKRRAESEIKSELLSKEQHIDWLSEPVDLEKAHETLRDSILPLWRLNYDPDQLIEKRNLVLKYLAETRRRLLLINPEIGNVDSVKFVEESDSKGQTTICKLAPIIPSYKGGSVAVGSFKSWNFMPRNSTKVIDALQKFVTACSKREFKELPPLNAFDPITYNGNWRHVLIRESRSGDTLVVLYINAYGFTEEDINNLLNELRTWFQTGPGSDSGLTSLYLSVSSRSGIKQSGENLRQVFGKPYIIEQCCGLNFHISISAFFQVNTLAAELLFERISCLCNLPSKNEITCNNENLNEKKRILLDVCCGTGTIALCLSKNVEFFAGKAENILRNTIDSLPECYDLSVVVDPPRAGLHHSVIQLLRNCKQIQRIIYISCNIEYAVENFLNFARPCSNKFTGIPFVPTIAEAVDLFPQTLHTEVILLLERIPSIP